MLRSNIVWYIGHRWTWEVRTSNPGLPDFLKFSCSSIPFSSSFLFSGLSHWVWVRNRCLFPFGRVAPLAVSEAPSTSTPETARRAGRRPDSGSWSPGLLLGRFGRRPAFGRYGRRPVTLVLDWV